MKTDWLCSIARVQHLLYVLKKYGRIGYFLVE